MLIKRVLLVILIISGLSLQSSDSGKPKAYAQVDSTLATMLAAEHAAGAYKAELEACKSALAEKTKDYEELFAQMYTHSGKLDKMAKATVDLERRLQEMTKERDTLKSQSDAMLVSMQGLSNSFVENYSNMGMADEDLRLRGLEVRDTDAK